MNTNTLEIIKNIISYIENNIKKKLTLEDISNYCNLSPFHIHKLFRTITNTKLMEYVRKRKLSCSIYELLNTNLKIIDIAYEYNFEHEQSYIRSFKNCFNISPHKLRKEKVAVEIVDKLSLKNLTALKEGGIALEPVIIMKPSFSIIGITHKVYNQENLRHHNISVAVNEFIRNYKTKVKNQIHPNTFIGYVKFVENVSDYIYYTTSFEVTDLSYIPDELTGINFPARKYAVFKFVFLCSIDNLTMVNINNITDYFDHWIYNSQYDMDGKFSITRINLGLLKENYTEYEVLIPIKYTGHSIKQKTHLIIYDN